jgi:AcrR family transcriptional regulator
MTTRTAASTRREQILKAAARLFAERGFHGVGVDEIGAAVGISGPGLYRHFPGKDAMLAELLVGISRRLLDGGRARTRGAAAGGPAAVLASLIDGHIDFALDDRPLITLHDRELDRLREIDRRMVRQLQRQYVELWVDTVRGLHPGVPEAEARASVHAVFGLLNSTPHFTSHKGGLPDRAGTEALLRRLAHGALDSLRAWHEPAALDVPCDRDPGGRGAPAQGPSGAPDAPDGPGFRSA